MRPVIALFAKAPTPGQVKTRLQPDYSCEQSAALHKAFVADMLGLLLEMTPVADIELHTDTVTDAWKGFRVSRQLQCSGDLGQRMHNAISAALSGGRPAAMIVGSDAPTLPAAHLAELLHFDSDVALGPSDDGGYYAIACRKADPAMFDCVAWSGPEALEGTIRSCRASGLTVATGKAWFDVDTPADLQRLAASPALPPHTLDWMLQNANHLLAGC